MLQQTENKQAGTINAGAGRQMNVMGHQVTVKLNCDQSGGAYYVFEVESPPGAGIPPHVHEREDEVIYILEGRYAVTIGDETQMCGPGTVLHFARHTPHGFANAGDTPGRTLWHVMPGDNFEPFFDELGALPPGPPDLQKVAAIFGAYNIDLV